MGGEGEKLKYGGCSMQGWRIDMEDAHTVEPRLTVHGQPFPTWSFFAVFDGHAGSGAARICSTRLFRTMLSRSEFKVISLLFSIVIF